MAVGPVILNYQHGFAHQHGQESNQFFLSMWHSFCFNCEMDGRADAFQAFRPNPTTHQLHEFAAYGQAQSYSSIFAGHSLIDLGEGLE